MGANGLYYVGLSSVCLGRDFIQQPPFYFDDALASSRQISFPLSKNSRHFVYRGQLSLPPPQCHRFCLLPIHVEAHHLYVLGAIQKRKKQARIVAAISSGLLVRSILLVAVGGALCLAVRQNKNHGAANKKPCAVLP